MQIWVLAWWCALMFKVKEDDDTHIGDLKVCDAMLVAQGSLVLVDLIRVVTSGMGEDGNVAHQQRWYKGEVFGAG